MLLGTFIRILTSLIRDFCTSDRNFASTFFQIPPHDGHPWSWLVVGHCDYNPHNRLSLSRYMPCPAYLIKGFHCKNPFFIGFYRLTKVRCFTIYIVIKKNNKPCQNRLFYIMLNGTLDHINQKR